MIKLVSVVIPVYKATLSDNERISLEQCARILGNKYDIILVCPNSLDVENYNIILKSFDICYSTCRFEDTYFQGIEGYNNLMISKCFYERFVDYQYILIYQLDAYIFKDELEYWCRLNYDYIGAPMINDSQTDDMSLSYYVGGNGGFSLRKISKFMDYFNGCRNVYTPAQIAKRINLWKKPHTRIFLWILMCFGYHNKPLTISYRNRWSWNEDLIWSQILAESNYSFRQPIQTEAAKFAFERYPSRLYSTISSLPFGCHAWARYEYDTFWNNFIPKYLK